MPTAFTVAAADSVKVPPLARYFAVPLPGTGFDPSVVYQIPVLPCGPAPDVFPLSVRVTVKGKVCEPPDGEIEGAAEVTLATVPLMLLPASDGVLLVFSSLPICWFELVS